MSLNNILLTPKLVADLYQHFLVEEQTLSKPGKNVKFLGKNEKSILILVANEGVAFMGDDELNFLSSVLGACKLSLADVAIVNLKNALSNSNYQFFINELRSTTVLLFNVEADAIDLPFNFPYFQIQQFNQTTFLSAPSLSEISGNKIYKTQLWNCLKTIFGL